MTHIHRLSKLRARTTASTSPVPLAAASISRAADAQNGTRNGTCKTVTSRVEMRTFVVVVLAWAAVLLVHNERSTGCVAFQPVTRQVGRRLVTAARASCSSLKSYRNLHEFDHILGERSVQQQQQRQQQQIDSKSGVHSRRKILLPGEEGAVLASSTFAAPGLDQEDSSAVEDYGGDMESAMTLDDPYADLLEESSSTMRYDQGQPTMSQGIENRLKNMDLQDIVSTLIIPSIIAFAGLRWGFNRVAARVADKTDSTLDTFASELIFHDSDFEEMEMCFKDYSKKLMWLGPRKTPAMLKRYLQLYSKKKTVSPQSISSLSYVFSLFKLSEERAAQILVSLCKDMGEEKISSAGKLLFFGSRILKSPEGKAALLPIKDMIKATYREASVADEMVDLSQQAMAEAAYRSAVIAGGKGQESLTIGWEVLGLDKETATRIFDLEAEEGFVSEREKMYGGQSTKYDSKGNIIDKEGNLLNPEDKIDGKDDDGVSSNGAVECSDCGYTLFIAKGRESKFFGEGFKCPNCGASKDRFEAKVIEED